MVSTGSLTVERGTVGDALPPGRPAPADRRRGWCHRPGVGLAALVVRPPDAPVEPSQLEPGPPELLPRAERVVLGAVPFSAGVLATLGPDGKCQGRVPLHPPELKTTQTPGTSTHQ